MLSFKPQQHQQSPSLTRTFILGSGFFYEFECAVVAHRYVCRLLVRQLPWQPAHALRQQGLQVLWLEAQGTAN